MGAKNKDQWADAGREREMVSRSEINRSRVERRVPQPVALLAKALVCGLVLGRGRRQERVGGRDGGPGRGHEVVQRVVVFFPIDLKAAAQR
jgi:hypothetical protein